MIGDDLTARHAVHKDRGVIYRISTPGVVLVATVAAAIASVYISPPWDMPSTVLAATGATASILLMAIRIDTRRRH